MKTTILICILAATTVLAGPLDNPNPTVSIQATAIYDAYEKNGLAANVAYKNKRASIGGQVIEVAQDDDGSPYLRLRGREGSYYGVKCRFATEAAQKLLNLKPGNKVAVHGTIEGRTGTSGDVVVVDCRMP